MTMPNQSIINSELYLRQMLADKLVDHDFKPQADYIKDMSPRKVAFCTRRGGKSMGVGRDFIRDAYHYPGANYLYLALTRQTAKVIMWDDVFKSLNRSYDLGMVPNESELSLRLDNGAKIWLGGADSSISELQKKLGGKLRKAHIDEAGSFRQDVEALAIEYLEPALSDMQGQLSMSGTPTELNGTYFHKVTSGEIDHGWKVHTWNTFQNPHMREQWATQIARLENTYGKDLLYQLPWFRRMYLGEWVTDTDSLVYKYQHGRNSIDELPKGRYTYILGIDLGYDDATAFVLAAYNDFQKNLYFVEAFKQSGMDITAVARKIEHYQSKFDIYDMVVDNAAKQAVEELKNRFNLPLEAAEKHGKADYIEIMNGEFIEGKIKLVDPKGATQPLAEEYVSLIWDESKKPKRLEHPRCPNHCSDGGLYAWRKHLAYMSEPAKTEPTEQEKLDEWEEQEAQAMEANRNQWLTDHL